MLAVCYICITLHTAFLPSCHFTHNSVCMFMRWGCVDDKQPWLHGWASLWRSPHHPPAETAAPPGNPESVPAVRNESWGWKEWPVVKRRLCRRGGRTPASGGQWRLSSQHPEPRCNRSYRPCGGPCMGRHTGLGGLPRGHHSVERHARWWPGP